MIGTDETVDQAKGHSACHIVSYLWVGKERVTAVTKWAEICPIWESKVLAALRVLACVALHEWYPGYLLSQGAKLPLKDPLIKGKPQSQCRPKP